MGRFHDIPRCDAGKTHQPIGRGGSQESGRRALHSVERILRICSVIKDKRIQRMQRILWETLCSASASGGGGGGGGGGGDGNGGGICGLD